MLTIEKKYYLDVHVYYYLSSQSNTTLDNSDDDNFIKTLAFSKLLFPFN